MKYRLPILSAAVGIAVALWASLRPMSLAHGPGSDVALSAPSKTSTLASDTLSPDERLRSAAAALAQRRSIEAKIRHRANLFGHQLVGSGLYLQQGGGIDAPLRLELRLQLSDQGSSLLQVCDGRYFWTRLELEGKPTLTRVDVARLKRAAGQGRAGDRPRTTVDTAIPLGGLPKLIAELAENFHFVEATEARIDGVSVRVLQGQWKPERLAALLPDQRDAILAGRGGDLEKLPAHVAHRVVVLLGRDDQFPYRVEYRRAAARTGKDGGDAGQPPEVALVTLELFEVRLDAGIAPRAFQYKPGDLEVLDETARYLR